MKIEKNGKIYFVKKNKNSWTLELVIEKITITYNVKKADCPNFDDLKSFIAESDLF